jgi:putative DNA primase/helicase
MSTDPSDTSVAAALAAAHESPPEEPSSFAAPAFSEEAVAIEFARRSKDALRYIPCRRQWMVWDGGWHPDLELAVQHAVRDLIREFAETLGAIGGDKAAGRARALASDKTVRAVLNLVRSDPPLVARAELWDQDPMLLGVPGGVVDLTTGVLLAPDPARLISQRTLVAPAQPETACPKWMKFLRDVTGEDRAFMRFLQRFAGYALTGSTQEHKLFYIHGPGRNGKSLFLNVLAAIFKDYARTAAPDLFVEKRHSQHLTMVAELEGARLVTAQEIDPGQSLRDSFIKQLVAADPVTANRMRQDPKTFVPQAKVAMTGNGPPKPQRPDAAMAARIVILPFAVMILPKRQNPKLFRELMEEAPAILRWCIDGCLLWQKHGLDLPPAVSDATAMFADAGDPIAGWIKACCEEVPAGERSRKHAPTATELHCSWASWAIPKGYPSGTTKMLSKNLQMRGYCSEKRSDGNVYPALRLRSSDVAESLADDTVAPSAGHSGACQKNHASGVADG